MYLEHFGLNEPPFRITPVTEFFFSGANRGEILLGPRLLRCSCAIVAAIAAVLAGQFRLGGAFVAKIGYLAGP